jgi:radical SAM superfamily enzyme YgiQ (UPF0313 family)
LIKTAIINVPRLEPHRPPPGPAIIANVCRLQGHVVTAYDLNIKFFHYCKDNNIDYHEFDQVWNQTTDFSTQQRKVFDNFLEYWCQKIAQENFDFVLVSVFGMACKVFTHQLLTNLRSRIQSKIIAGGMGIGVHDLTDAQNCYGKKLRDQGLIDIFVAGEGELAVVNAINGVPGPGINNNNPVQIDQLDPLPWPDYSFYNLDEYDYLVPGQKEVYITGSRGCVRKCTYCDIERFWPKYRYRSGQNIADEIILNYEKFGITRYYFTDSLVNGSLKMFSDMCDKLSNYKFDRPISWSGQFIFRDRKSVPRDHFAMMSQAGADILYVGIETGSDRVRAAMGKKFTNEDIDFQLEECSKYGIKIMPLMFTGYITETIDDHYENLSVFKRWQRYVADGTIIGVELGSSLIILPGAPVERMIESHGLEFMMNDAQEPGTNLWWSSKNPDLTIRERVRRKLEVHETAIKYAWPVWRQASRLEELRQLVLKNNLGAKEPQKFFKLISSNEDKKQSVLSRVANV